jgi:hypothetical protein
MKGKFLFSFAVVIFPVLAFTILPIPNLEVGTDLPTGATFNTTTHVFYWRPTHDQIGTYRFRFRVSDEHGGVAEEVINVTVNAIGG